MDDNTILTEENFNAAEHVVPVFDKNVVETATPPGTKAACVLSYEGAELVKSVMPFIEKFYCIDELNNRMTICYPSNMDEVKQFYTHG